MPSDLLPYRLAQPVLFDFGEKSTGVLELFPAVWKATEELVAPETSYRHAALDRLIELGAPRLSPLVAYVLATRLKDPDLKLRARIVQVLAELLSSNGQGQVAPEAVRSYVTAYLAQMRTRSVFGLLEVAEFNSRSEPQVARLLNSCPNAGRHLADILSERKVPITIRQKAAHFIGVVGYLDARPALERLETRLQARLSGQQAMPFAPVNQPDETQVLLPAIRNTLALLSAV